MDEGLRENHIKICPVRIVMYIQGHHMLNSFKSLAETDLFSLFTPKRQLVGLDIGSSGIKLVQLKENRGRYILQKFGFKPLEPEVIVDGTVMDEGRVVSAIKELFEETNDQGEASCGVDFWPCGHH